MKVKFYLVSFLLLLFIQTLGQDCSTLTASYTTSESRCVSTGAITVNVTGGSGNYNFKASGPITTPVTSSNIISGLPAGYYKIVVTDLTLGCSFQMDSAFVVGSYGDPRFQLSKTDATCSGNDGTVTVINQQFGRSPFTYTIMAPSPSGVGTSNTTGLFTGLTPGEYAIRLQDSCGGIQVRRITIENYSWIFDSVAVTRLGCDSAHVFIRLADNKGNNNTSGATFSGYGYGIVINPGDTTWMSESSFNIFIGTRRNLTIVVKDNCGNIQPTSWSLPSNLKPSLGSVSFTNMSCASLTASITGQLLTNPQYCLYNSSNVLLECNTNGVFTNLSYTSYCIVVSDLCYDTTITRCFAAMPPAPSIDAMVTITNKSCSTFTATISGQQNLYNPTYCLYDQNSMLISCNNAGFFAGVPYGTYCIEVQDACSGTIISRCFTVVKPLPVLTSYNITASTCSTFNVGTSGDNLTNALYCLYDNAGNVVSCDSSGNFTGISHGQYCIRAITCGDTSNSICFTTSRPVPSTGPGVQITYKNCNTFGVALWGQTNLNSPQYCLYDQNDVLLRCNATGVFDSLAYGAYCIKLTNTCYDTTITRCFTQLKEIPTLNSTMQVLNSNCTAVTFQASGYNLTSPVFCLYNTSNNLIACNSTGLFSDQPYGTYCVEVADGCVDTIIRVCQTFNPVRGITLYTSKSCAIGKTFIDVQFTNSNTPYTIDIFHPNGSNVYSTTTSVNPLRIELSALPAGTQYKIVGTDACSNRDSATIIPDANLVTRSINVRAKCPSAIWLNGAGDLVTTISSNFFTVSPQIIKKDGVDFSRGYSSVTGNQYNFADLEPAQYIVQYTQSTCNGQLYDTVTIPPYAYPSQGQSAIYQCDNNSFSMGANVQGGVSPYSYQIIGSLPEQPSISSAPQQDAVFSINTGTVYSLVRLRTIDACGNATLNDVSILPLQNLAVSASNTCFYQNIVLSVDTVPNAYYSWYKKTSPIDSVLIGSGTAFTLPFFLPEQIGEYVCKVVVNNGCVTRVSSFNLDGDCGYLLLPVSFQLYGRNINQNNQVYWSKVDERHVLRYEVERKQAHEKSYRMLKTVADHGKGDYRFDDEQPGAGVNLYRLKIFFNEGFTYTNVVSLKNKGYTIVVYPNPVHHDIHIGFSGNHPVNYRIEMLAANGQLVLLETLKNIVSTTITYQRNNSWQPGIYVLRVTDTETGISEMRKIILD